MNLLDIVSRARSVIEESDGADEHAELIAELRAVEAEIPRLSVVERVVEHLDGQVWNADTLEDIARDLRAAGYTIADTEG